MKQIKILITLLIILSVLPGCRGLKEKLTMKKDKNVDEFLIEKKNPLILPPNFSKLPKPKNNSKIVIKKNEDLDLSEIFKADKENKNQNSSNELEKSISNILNKK
jgi:hypothetical protein